MQVAELARELGRQIAQGRGHYEAAAYLPSGGEGCTEVTHVEVREASQIVELYANVTSVPDAITWGTSGGYEVSSQGDKRFSALFAKMPDGRTIEQWYQCDIKCYEIGGTNWKLGKGKPPLVPFPKRAMWEMYLGLWRIWAIHNFQLMNELRELLRNHGDKLTDKFASTEINQARALAVILNEWFN